MGTFRPKQLPQILTNRPLFDRAGAQLLLEPRFAPSTPRHRKVAAAVAQFLVREASCTAGMRCNLMSSVGIGGIRNSIFKKDVSPADTKKTEFQ